MEDLSVVLPWAGGLIGLILLVICIVGSLFTVEQQTIAVVERFGKFVRLAGPGLNLKIPFVEKVVERKDLRITPMDVEVETKTKDNVFVKLRTTVHYHVMADKVYEAHYKLRSPKTQIESYVFDVVRARVPGMKLDEVFENKDTIADTVKSELTQTMDDYGYSIIKALVTDIDPDKEVKKSMNEINAAERARVAAEARGEAEKTLVVKAAEAESDSKRLQGEGIAKQRKAIAEGLRESVQTMKEGLDPDVDAKHVLTILLATQYFDTLGSIAKHSRTNTVLLPHSPGGLSDVMNQLRQTLIVANQVPSAGNGEGGDDTSAPPSKNGASGKNGTSRATAG